MNSQELTSVPAPTARMGRFKASKQIVRESWAVLKQDKEIFWFPILAAIVGLTIFATVGLAYYYGVMDGDFNRFEKLDQGTAEVLAYAAGFLYYLVMFFTVNFFDAGILTIVYARFNGQDLTFRDGIHGASQNFGKIFIFSAISATVGIILDFIANNFKLVGKLVAVVLGSAWNILTYFSLPSLVIGQTSIINSFKESAAIIRKTWGETIIIEFGVGLFFGLIILSSFFLSIGIVVVFPYIPVMIGVATVFVLLLIAIAIISSALGMIFKLALYEYARTGRIPQGFSPELIQNAIKKK